MTTPQTVLWNIEYNTKRIMHLLEGKSTDDFDGHEGDIREVLRAIEIETTEFNERMQLLEDKMNLIIKLLGKPDEKKDI